MMYALTFGFLWGSTELRKMGKEGVTSSLKGTLYLIPTAIKRQNILPRIFLSGLPAVMLALAASSNLLGAVANHLFPVYSVPISTITVSDGKTVLSTGY